MSCQPRITALMCFLIATLALNAQTSPKGSSEEKDDPEVRPAVSKADVQIVQRAREILNRPEKWNRADNRVCPDSAKAFSLYCALEKATKETIGSFAHRGAAMQEVRFVIDDIAPNRKSYHHRLMDYNNDPTTTFADIQKVFRMLEDRIVKRLAEEAANQK